MAISLNGSSKLIVLDTDTTFTAQAIYNACVSWAQQSGNMQYLLPMISAGKVPRGNGVYTDIIFTLANGYKLKPSGYAPDTQVSITGSLTVSDNSAYAVPPSSGSPVQWFVEIAPTATIVNVGGSSLTTEEHNQLFGLSTATLEKLLRNKTVTDPATGVMTVYDNDGTTVLFTCNLWENVAGTQPYRGQGAERRDRLA